MRTTTRLAPLALVAALAACSAEKVTEEPAPDSGTAPAAETTGPETTGPETAPAAAEPASSGEGPAGEVAAESRKPTEAVEEAAAEVAEAAGNALPDGLSEKDWGMYWKHIDFVFGSEAGMTQAKETGKPMMIFYTATW